VGYDGSRDWIPCERCSDTPVDPESIRIKLPGNPPREQFSTSDVEEIERCHRLPYADYWAAYVANEAALAKARIEQQVKAEAERAEAERLEAERAALRIVTRPRPRPKSFWQKLWGGK